MFYPKFKPIETARFAQTRLERKAYEADPVHMMHVVGETRPRRIDVPPGVLRQIVRKRFDHRCFHLCRCGYLRFEHTRKGKCLYDPGRFEGYEVTIQDWGYVSGNYQWLIEGNDLTTKIILEADHNAIETALL